MPGDPADVPDARSLELILQHAPVILFTTNAHGQFTYSQGRGLDALGVHAHELRGRRIQDLYSDRHEAQALMSRVLAGEAASGIVQWGSQHYHAHLHPHYSADGQLLGVTGVAVDITAQVVATRQTETLLQLSAMLDESADRPTLHGTLSAALEALSHVMPLDFLILWGRQAGEYHVVVSHGDVPTPVEQAARLGVPAELVATYLTLAGAEGAAWAGATLPAAVRTLGLTAVAVLPLASAPSTAPLPDALLCACRVRAPAEWTAEEWSLLRAAARSLTVIQARRQHLAELEGAALTDALTGLGNRRAFDRDLAVTLARAQHEQRAVALLVIDLDGLKALNDSEGHQRGDALIHAFGSALQRFGGNAQSYRLSGDEFAVLWWTDAHDSGAALLEQVVEAVRAESFPAAGASGGVAVYPVEATDASELLRLADQRMYAMKLRHRLARLP